MGAFKALERATNLAREGQKIYILLDNQAAVRALQTGVTSSSMGVARRFQELANTFDVTIKWVPGHSKIRGNEAADASARAGLSQLPQPDTVPRVITTAYLRRLMNQKRQELLDNWWNKACPSRNR